MVITIIGVVILAIFYSIPLLKQAADKGTETKRADEYKTVEPFKVSDYYDRTQQQQGTLQEEKENQEPYAIILWWGIDGLRMNDDGSFEWIRKNNKNENSKQQLQLENIQNIKAILEADIQTQIENLRYELIRQQTQAAQIQQTQNIINSLQSSPYPQCIRYPAQCGINQYTPDLTWCCCQVDYIRGD